MKRLGALPPLMVVLAGCGGVPAFEARVPAPTCQDVSAALGGPAATALAGPRNPVSSRILAAGGGRPRTGYVGASAAACFPQSKELSTGWAIDVNYTQNLADQFSVELSLGLLRYDVERGGLDGSLSSTTIGAIAQAGWPFGASRWYAGAGLARWLNDLSDLGGGEADNSWALIAAAGVDLELWVRVNLCIEFRYTVADADLAGGGDLDLDAFAARGNCVFRF